MYEQAQKQSHCPEAPAYAGPSAVFFVRCGGAVRRQPPGPVGDRSSPLVRPPPSPQPVSLSCGREWPWAQTCLFPAQGNKAQSGTTIEVTASTELLRDISVHLCHTSSQMASGAECQGQPGFFLLSPSQGESLEGHPGLSRSFLPALVLFFGWVWGPSRGVTSRSPCLPIGMTEPRVSGELVRTGPALPSPGGCDSVGRVGPGDLHFYQVPR